MLLFLVVLLLFIPILFPRHSSLQQPPPNNPVEYDYPFCVQKVSSLGHPISPIIPSSSCNAGIALLFPNGTVLPPGGFPFVLPNVTHKGVIIIKFAFVRLYSYCLQLMLGLPKSEEIVPVNSMWKWRSFVLSERHHYFTEWHAYVGHKWRSWLPPRHKWRGFPSLIRGYISHVNGALAFTEWTNGAFLFTTTVCKRLPCLEPQ